MTASTVLGGSGIQKTRSANDELDQHKARKTDKEWDSYRKRQRQRPSTDKSHIKV